MTEMFILTKGEYDANRPVAIFESNYKEIDDLQKKLKGLDGQYYGCDRAKLYKSTDEYYALCVECDKEDKQREIDSQRLDRESKIKLLEEEIKKLMNHH